MLEVIQRRPFEDTDLSAVQESVARVVEGDPEPDDAYQILALVESQAKRDGHPSSTVGSAHETKKIVR